MKYLPERSNCDIPGIFIFRINQRGVGYFAIPVSEPEPDIIKFDFETKGGIVSLYLHEPPEKEKLRYQVTKRIKLCQE